MFYLGWIGFLKYSKIKAWPFLLMLIFKTILLITDKNRVLNLILNSNKKCKLLEKCGDAREIAPGHCSTVNFMRRNANSPICLPLT